MKQIPDAIQKRDLLHGHKKMTDSQRSDLVTALRDAGWVSDAIDFQTNDAKKLADLKALAIEEGNVFLLGKILRILGDENQDDLLAAAVNAESLGKFRYAIKAYEKLGKTEKVEALRSELADDGDMKVALNSVFIPKSEEDREQDNEDSEDDA